MSVRSELRAEATIRDNYRCRWPHCNNTTILEMAHIIPAGSGGQDVLGNVVMLCKPHHDMYDARTSWQQAFDATVELYWAWLQVGTIVEDVCWWPGCDLPARNMCEFHTRCVSVDVPVHGRNTAIRVLLAAYLDATK